MDRRRVSRAGAGTGREQADKHTNSKDKRGNALESCVFHGLYLLLSFFVDRIEKVGPTFYLLYSQNFRKRTGIAKIFCGKFLQRWFTKPGFYFILTETDRDRGANRK